MSRRRRWHGASDPPVNPPVEPDERVLHLLHRRGDARALCGALVATEGEATEAGTAGRDRCTECLVIAAKLRRGKGVL